MSCDYFKCRCKCYEKCEPKFECECKPEHEYKCKPEHEYKCKPEHEYKCKRDSGNDCDCFEKALKDFYWRGFHDGCRKCGRKENKCEYEDYEAYES